MVEMFKLILNMKITTQKLYKHLSLKKFNTPEMQIAGWQAILNNFKSYTEHHYALKFVN